MPRRATSITELCLADHQDDPAILDKWLANKTSANVRSWIARPDAHMFVATDGKAIVGVAAVTTSGEVTLNYVSPDARFRGVSKALLKRLEAKAAELGNERCVLTSTDTARGFYLSAGMWTKDFHDWLFHKLKPVGWRNGSPVTADRSNRRSGKTMRRGSGRLCSMSAIGSRLCGNALIW